MTGTIATQESSLRYRALRIVGCVAMPICLGACFDEPKTTAQTTDASLERVEKKFDEAQEEAREITDDLAANLRSQLKRLEKMIKDLEANAKAAEEPETRLILEESARDLEVKRLALTTKLEEIEKASQEAWDRFRVELEHALVEFTAAYDKALEKAKTE